MYNYIYINATQNSHSYRNIAEGWLCYGDDDIDEVRNIVESATKVKYEESADEKKLSRNNHIKMTTKPVNIDYDIKKNVSIIHQSENKKHSLTGIVTVTCVHQNINNYIL